MSVIWKCTRSPYYLGYLTCRRTIVNVACPYPTSTLAAYAWWSGFMDCWDDQVDEAALIKVGGKRVRPHPASRR